MYPDWTMTCFNQNSRFSNLGFCTMLDWQNSVIYCQWCIFYMIWRRHHIFLFSWDFQNFQFAILINNAVSKLCFTFEGLSVVFFCVCRLQFVCRFSFVLGQQDQVVNSLIYFNINKRRSVLPGFIKDNRCESKCRKWQKLLS